MLKGKTALVTGSTSGIGFGIAKPLAPPVAHIVLKRFGHGDTAPPALLAAGPARAASCCTTTRGRSVGTSRAASMAAARMSTRRPRRMQKSAPISATASASFSRVAMAAAPNPENIGRTMQPTRASARNAIATSGAIGRETPTASPGLRPSDSIPQAPRLTCVGNSA